MDMPESQQISIWVCKSNLIEIRSLSKGGQICPHSTYRVKDPKNMQPPYNSKKLFHLYGSCYSEFNRMGRKNCWTAPFIPIPLPIPKPEDIDTRSLLVLVEH